ncbi:hypothetical protein HYS90_01680 [Candidatus Curtissbacteria bacterium]|nr:hypothetical protein [Candidatus Curtissbacteria bacterium]
MPALHVAQTSTVQNIWVAQVLYSGNLASFRHLVSLGGPIISPRTAFYIVL